MREVAVTTTDRGNALARLLLRLAGWRVTYQGTPPGCGVIIAYPHTSNWDFVVGIMAKWSTGIPVAFLSKDSLFRVPLLGRFVRFCGGVPVDRSNASGVINEMSERLRQAQERGERWWLAIAPEGTRKKGDGWRSGFYQIAVAAQAPIGLAYFNFANKEIGVTIFLMPSGDAVADLRQIDHWYLGCAKGKYPDQQAPVRFLRQR